jgi:hypothetical protein
MGGWMRSFIELGDEGTIVLVMVSWVECWIAGRCWQTLSCGGVVSCDSRMVVEW